MMMTDNDFQLAIQKMSATGLQMDTVLINQEGKQFSHVFPSGTQRKNIRSISKSIQAICVGLAIEEGFFPLGVNEPIFKYITNRVNEDNINIEYLKELTLRHLLTLTMGHSERSMNSDQMKTLEGKDLLDFLLNFPMTHKAGSFFLYTNPPAYLMSYIFQTITGKKVLDYAKEKIFEPLGIENVTWKESEQGYNMGCTGIEISAQDLMKIGVLLLNKGEYNGNQIVSQKWISEMSRAQVPTPKMFDEKRVLPKFAYGYNIWVCENGNFYGDGTDGQYLIIVPKKKMVIVTFGFQSNMKPITECLKDIIL